MLNSAIEILHNSPAMFYSFVMVIGLLIGSFLNVVIVRMPTTLMKIWRKDCEEFLKLEMTQTDSSSIFLDLVYPRSTCPKCKTKIRIFDNIPVISYLILRGRCRDCKQPISMHYPIIEFLTAGLCLLVALRYGVSWQALAGCVLTCCLLVQSNIDANHTFIPDELTVPMTWIGLLLSLTPVFVDSSASIIGGISGYLSLWSIATLFYIATGKEGMGAGDFKLLAMLGCWLGWQVIPFIILLSSILGSILGVLILVITKKDRNTRIPFGPFIAIAGFIALLWGPAINVWYFSSMGVIL